MLNQVIFGAEDCHQTSTDHFFRENVPHFVHKRSTRVRKGVISLNICPIVVTFNILYTVMFLGKADTGSFRNDTCGFLRISSCTASTFSDVATHVDEPTRSILTVVPDSLNF